jgi:NAD-dependent DNA ligase
MHAYLTSCCCEDCQTTRSSFISSYCFTPCRNGRLALAATRGDGSQGEDVTHNALTGAIQGMPLALAASSSSSSNGGGGGSSLPVEVEVRGEVFMTTSDFEQVKGEESAGSGWYYRVGHVMLAM